MSRNPQIQTITKMFGFINELGERLRNSGCGTGGTQEAPLVSRFPGLQQLFNSLVSANPTARKVSDRAVEEWNPFSQRVLLSDENPPRMSEFERNFALLPAYVQTFVEWSHEAVHVLALEPFFCGYRNVSSKDAFVQWNLANEALAFWYADIVITPAIRKSVPGADLVYSRCSVSNTDFHPEQAFQQIRISNRKTILRLYAEAFLGQESRLSATRGYPSALAHQIGEFYHSAITTLGNWYNVLEEFDFFGGYYDRFCAKANLPGMWSKSVLESLSDIDFGKYAVRVGTIHVPRLANLRPTDIDRVAVRRHIQTRAYTAWFLMQSALKHWIRSLDRPVNETRLVKSLQAYLDGLESALDALAQGRHLHAIIDQIKALDSIYDKTIHCRLARSRAYTKYRYWLFPFFAPTGGIIGLADSSSSFSTEEMLAIVRFVLKRLDWSSGTPSTMSAAINLLQKFWRACASRRQADVAKCYNSFMMHPDVLPHWSVPLSSIRPSRNQSREIIFEFT